jgi:hypothetical protein
MTRRIPLTQGKVALVDDADYPWLAPWDWRFSSAGYALRTIYPNDQRRHFHLHRVLMNAQRGQLVDHINGNRLDNRRANLRLVTRSQNQWNRRPNAKGSSPYKGVCWHRKGWMSRIRVHERRLHLGYYPTPELAAQVYDAAARRLFGLYAQLNFPHLPPSPALETLLDRRLAGKQSPAPT